MTEERGTFRTFEHNGEIPVEKSDEWEAFLEIPSDDERAWTPPKWAGHVEGGLTFTDPQS